VDTTLYTITGLAWEVLVRLTITDPKEAISRLGTRISSFASALFQAYGAHLSPIG